MKRPYLIVGILVVIVLALLAFAFTRNEKDELEEPLPAKNGVSIKTNIADTKVVHAYDVQWNGKSFSLFQRCVTGDIQPIPASTKPNAPTSICVGDNRLILVSSDEKQFELDKTETVNPSGAPAIYDVTLTNNVLSIDYAIDNCAMFNDCSVPSPHTPIQFNLATMKSVAP